MGRKTRSDCPVSATFFDPTTASQIPFIDFDSGRMYPLPVDPLLRSCTNGCIFSSLIQYLYLEGSNTLFLGLHYWSYCGHYPASVSMACSLCGGGSVAMGTSELVISSDRRKQTNADVVA